MSEELVKNNENNAMEEMAKIAARMKATEYRFEILGHGTKIYFVDKNWETSIIKNDGAVKEVSNLKEFREAFKNTDIKTIFIPYLNADGVKTKDILPIVQLRRICSEFADAKVIYVEESGE